MQEFIWVRGDPHRHYAGKFLLSVDFIWDLNLLMSLLAAKLSSFKQCLHFLRHTASARNCIFSRPATLIVSTPLRIGVQRHTFTVPFLRTCFITWQQSHQDFHSMIAYSKRREITTVKHRFSHLIHCFQVRPVRLSSWRGHGLSSSLFLPSAPFCSPSSASTAHYTYADLRILSTPVSSSWKMLNTFWTFLFCRMVRLLYVRVWISTKIAYICYSKSFIPIDIWV